jgi:hypothetical protein
MQQADQADHLTGKKHVKKVTAAAAGNPEAGPLTIDIGNRTLQSRPDSSHSTGKRQVANVGKSSAVGTPPTVRR